MDLDLGLNIRLAFVGPICGWFTLRKPRHVILVEELQELSKNTQFSAIVAQEKHQDVDQIEDYHMLTEK